MSYDIDSISVKSEELQSKMIVILNNMSNYTIIENSERYFYMENLKFIYDEVSRLNDEIHTLLSKNSVFLKNNLLFDHLISIYNEHDEWLKTIETLTYSLDKKITFSRLKKLSLHMLKIDGEYYYEDFPNLHYMKKYMINDDISFILINNHTSQHDKVDFIDISILRTLFLLYKNSIFRVRNKHIFKYLSLNDSENITKKQQDFISSRLKKLENIEIIVDNRILNKVYKEKFIYFLKLDENDILILKKPVIFELSKKYNRCENLDANAVLCPISMTTTGLITKEYLVYKMLLRGNKFNRLYFNDIYSELNIHTFQKKKKIRDIIIKILEYWKNINIIKKFRIHTENNHYIYIDYQLLSVERFLFRNNQQNNFLWV